MSARLPARWLSAGLWTGAVAALAGLAGCETLGYYSQAASGQLRLLYQREPVEAILARLDDGELSEEERTLRRQLELSQEMLTFAEAELGLDVGGRYRAYVELTEPNVVWNLFAAPELSLEPRVWCYPFVGCAPYRGYFDRQRAERYQAKLDSRGLDTYLGGVAAYSTLGWFDDPLLSSFIRWPEARLAELLFHELAHSRVWVAGDVAFNEAFASFVGRRAMARWLERRGRVEALVEHDESSRTQRKLNALLLQGKEALGALYAADLSEARKRSGKAEIVGALQGCAENLADAGTARRQRINALFGRLNNALLVSVATYQNNVPAFAALFEDAGDDWPSFFAAVDALAELDADERAARVERLRERQVADHADDDGADEIQCEALAGHRLDAEAPG